MSVIPLSLPPRTLPDPPTALDPDTFAAGLYESLAPLAQLDDQQSWALLKLCNAIGLMFQVVEDLVRDQPEGPGWSLLLDLDRCPDVALPWLGQFVGVRVTQGATPTQQRAQIAARLGWQRGTPQAIRDAVAATLTGSKTVVFRERDSNGADPPYTLTVITYAAETPDPAATQRAILSQKPAGIVLTYATNTGQDYQSVKTNNATYTALRTRFPDYASMLTAAPPV